MNTITVTYTLKYRLSTFPEYQFTTDKQCYNIKTGRRIKQTLCGGSIGYCIKGRFMSLKSLRPLLELIPKKEVMPF